MGALRQASRVRDLPGPRRGSHRPPRPSRGRIRRAIAVQRITWRAMNARMIALAAAAVLLLTTSGCGGKSTPQSSTPGTPSSSEITKPIDQALAQRLDAAVNKAMTAAGVPGAIVGIWGPTGDYVRAFGVADKATGAPMKTDFYSRIGSVTKTFAVTAILQL